MARGTIICRNWRATLGFPPAARATRRRVLSAFQHLAKIHPARLPTLVLAKEAALREIRKKKLGPGVSETRKLMVSDKSQESLSVMVSRILTLIEGQIEVFKSAPGPDQLSRQLGGAGLIRCCEIVRGICHLENVNLGALTPVLVRLHWETWLVSIYVLLGGKAAIDDLEADDVYWKRLLNEKLEMQLPYPKSEWQGTPIKLNFWDLSEKIKPLLLRAGEPTVPKGSSSYDVMYRVQSTFGAHANLHSLLLHIDLVHDELAIKANPVCPLAPAAQIPAVNTAHLAKYVFKAFGLPSDRIEALGETLLDL